MSRTTLVLPEGYAKTGELQFKGDKKARIRLYAATALIMGVLLAIGNAYLPVYLVFYDGSGQLAGLPLLLVKLGVLILFLVFYSLIHEKIHAHFMQRLSGAKAAIEFQGAAAYARSEAYFSKRDFAVITLAPFVLGAAAIFILTLLLTPDWFWIGYIAQVINLAGSAGDFYAALKITQQPSEVLIQDGGPMQTYYAPSFDESGAGRISKRRGASAQRAKKQSRRKGKR